MKILTIILCLIATNAWATTYYMRADGTAANKEAATACLAASTAMSVAVHNAETFSAGDTIYLCSDGGDYSAKLIPPSNGSNGSNIVYDSIGVVFDMDSAVDYGINISGRTYLTFQGPLEITGATAAGFFGNFDYFAGTPAAGANDITVSGLNSHDNGTCGLQFTVYYSSRQISGTISDSSFTDNGTCGTDITGNVGTLVMSNLYNDGNGATVALGGMYFSNRHTEVTADWADEGGGVYSRTVTDDDASIEDVYRVNNETDETDFTQNTSTPTTPSAQEFGYDTDAEVLYVRLTGDANPNTKTMEYSYTHHQSITVTGCTTINQARPAAAEGHGLMADDYASVTVSGHTSRGNAGADYSFNRNSDSSLKNSSSSGPGADNVFVGAYTQNMEIDNNSLNIAGTKGIAITLPNSGTIIKGNIIANSTDNALYATGAIADETCDSNFVYNAGAANSNVDCTNETNSDPLFLSATDLRLKQNSSARGAGLGTKFNGLPADAGGHQTSEFIGPDGYTYYNPGYPLGSELNTVTLP